MNINNFNSNIQLQNQSLDVCTYVIQEASLDLCANPIQEEPLDLRINRVQTEALDLHLSDQALIDVFDPSIPVDLSKSVAIAAPVQPIFQVNFEASTSRSMPPQKCYVQILKKKIINAAIRDSNGKVIALNFSKIFFNQSTLCNRVFKSLDIIFNKPDIYKTVKKIILNNNKLRRLPESIVKFTNLKSIDLSNNRFSTIPFQIYSFKKLKKLFLKNNSINYISTQSGRLKHLEEIHLNGNHITKIHRKLFSLKKLHTLDLSQNALIDVPTSIHNLRALETLRISGNNLFTIPTEIFGKNLEYLDLSDNHIDSIPSAIKNSRELRDINFDNNEIVNIPDEIGDLPHITAVCFNNNSTLRGFSENLYKLLPSCIVGIDYSGLSLSILSEIKDRSAATDYNGPIFAFSLEAAQERMEERLVESLYKYSHRPVPRSFNHLRSLSDQLEMWLNRLYLMSDFQHFRNNPSLPESIIDCIEYAEANAEYRKLFKDIIEGAAATCGDGIALSIIDIGIAKHVLTLIESNQIVELSDFLLSTVFSRQILQKIAGQKITLLQLEAKLNHTSVAVDDVEVYLVYPILLKERLNLSINIHSMVTQLVDTAVTEEDLEIAALEVEKQRTDKQACAEFLVNNIYWTELLKKLHPEEYEAIHEKSIEMVDESDLVAQEYRRNSLIILSGITL